MDTGDSVPTYAKVRQLSEEKYKSSKQEFSAFLQAGVIRPSKFPWSSPINLAPKSTPGNWRVYVDFRHLKQQTKPDRYLIPNNNSLGAKLFKKTVFSKNDILQVNHQILTNKTDNEKSAMKTPFGLFEFVFMSFGQRNSCSTFQRYMDNIFMDVSWVFVYNDDIFLSLRVFVLLYLSLFLFPQRFSRYVPRHSSGVCRTREPSWNFELCHLLKAFNPPYPIKSDKSQR